MKRKYKMLSIKLLVAIYLGISLSNGALADSSVATPSSGIIHKSTVFILRE